MNHKTGEHSMAPAGPSLVLAAYRPREGRLTELLELVHGHVPALRKLGLVTDRPATVMQAADGTVLEVFEWASGEAVTRAHEDPVVLQLWERFAACCDHVPPAQVAECAQLFPHFSPIATI